MTYARASTSSEAEVEVGHRFFCTRIVQFPHGDGRARRDALRSEGATHCVLHFVFVVRWRFVVQIWGLCRAEPRAHAKRCTEHLVARADLAQELGDIEVRRWIRGGGVCAGEQCDGVEYVPDVLGCPAGPRASEEC